MLPNQTTADISQTLYTKRYMLSIAKQLKQQLNWNSYTTVIRDKCLVVRVKAVSQLAGQIYYVFLCFFSAR